LTFGIRQTSQFKKDFKLCIKRGLKIEEFTNVVTLLRNGDSLPEQYKDHQLKSSKYYKNCRELQIQPDWLLIYKYTNDNVILLLVRTGSHSDLFKK